MKKKTLRPLSLAHIVFLAAIQLSIILVFFDIKLALVPLYIFAFFCVIAPFMVRLSFFLPIISKGRTGKGAVAITFDDGPDPAVTPGLLEILSKYSVKATFFVTGEKAARHSQIIRQILEHGHSIGNHSYSHDPVLMLKRAGALNKEIESTQEALIEFGIKPYAFRPPVGITNPRLRKVLLKLGMYCITFSCRAFDGGNRKVNGIANRILKKVKPDDIILLHDVSPVKTDNVKILFNEIEKTIKGIKDKGLEIISLSELIKRPVMESNYISSHDSV